MNSIKRFQLDPGLQATHVAQPACNGLMALHHARVARVHAFGTVGMAVRHANSGHTPVNHSIH